MLIGKGLIASAFKHYSANSNVILFASGVSNSREIEVVKYKREFELLKNYSSSTSKLIYFSTCSVFDESLKQSAYIQHKLKIEKYISENFSSFIIFRLPIVVGNSSNPHTLTNFLFNTIKTNQHFLLFANAYRYLIDVDDLSVLLSGIIDSSEYDNKILNICFDNKISILEMVSIFEKIIKKKALYEIKKEGSVYTPNNFEFINYLKKINFEIKTNYNEDIIAKYYSNR
ncbi:MAG TPA: hypothetical protein VIN73_03340 [Vicingaceae bacterium]